MKLTDIIVQEAGPEGNAPVELKDLTKYFPNTYKKAVKTLARSNRLMFGGDLVYKNDEDGPAIHNAEAAAENEIEEMKFPLTIEMDGSVADLDEYNDFTVDFKIDDSELVYVGYTERGDGLVLGYDAWLSEDEFNSDWDDEFEKTFGEDYDHDNSDHKAIYDHAWEKFKESMRIGVIAIVNDKGAVKELDAREGGFYKSGLMQANRSIEIFGE